MSEISIITTYETRPGTQEAPAKPLYPELLEAAALIREGGLIKGQFAKGSQRCIRGALNEVLTGDPFNDAVERHPITQALLTSSGRGSTLELALWNNREETTEEQVIAALERAAWGL